MSVALRIHEDHDNDLAQLVREFRACMRRRHAAGVEAGQILLKIKERLAHEDEDSFCEFVRKHCHVKRRHAYRLMFYAGFHAACLSVGLCPPTSEWAARPMSTVESHHGMTAAVNLWRGLSEDGKPSPAKVQEAVRKLCPAGHNSLVSRKNDNIPTPLSACSDPVKVEVWKGLVWEPCQGDGRLTKAIQRAGIEVVGSDEEDGTNFLSTDLPPGKKERPWGIVMNPPYSKKDKFIWHAMDVATHKIAALLSGEFVYGQKRYASGIFTNKTFPLARVWHYTNRLYREDTGKGAQFPQAWFIWERGYKGPPAMGWISTKGFRGMK